MTRRDPPLLEWWISELSTATVVVRAADWWSALQTLLTAQRAPSNPRNIAYQVVSETMILVEDIVARRRFVVHRNHNKRPTEALESQRFLAVKALLTSEEPAEWILERPRTPRRRKRPPRHGGVVFDAQYH